MLSRLATVVIFVPIAIVLIALAVANRGAVAFTLDPFRPGNPNLTLELPLFVFIFAAVGVGIVIGGAATWVRQGQYRKLARQRGAEAERLRAIQRATPPAANAGALPKPAA